MSDTFSAGELLMLRLGDDIITCIVLRHDGVCTLSPDSMHMCLCACDGFGVYATRVATLHVHSLGWLCDRWHFDSVGMQKHIS